ncbi:hypothetical protein Leucomu_05705 [Leucobacter muris]|uniref:Uncharacterized protein n=1 Tax=Leucobacter muris TaxID=1935379 RepID=A0ABX5QEH6_9MICO|nr:hypothetical protein [Leucobacter muris]QAB17483.1 hypothetical protein Leucomu_05705 [Leucobacter muris]
MDRYQFDPAEDAWVAYLKSVQDTHVSTNVPRERPERFIEVERTGGASGLASDDAQMTFRCWAESRAAAAAFASETERLVMLARTLAGRPVGRKTVIASSVYLPDPISGADRYQFTIRAAIRGKFPTP